MNDELIFDTPMSGKWPVIKFQAYIDKRRHGPLTR